MFHHYTVILVCLGLSKFCGMQTQGTAYLQDFVAYTRVFIILKQFTWK